MDDYLSFEATVEPMEWGRSTYTIIRVPHDIAQALAVQGARRVEGEINDHPVNLALTKSPVIDGVFVYAGKTLLRRIGIEPREPLMVRLRKADETEVDTPNDIAKALRDSNLTDRWMALTPGKQRSMLYQIETAKRAETRAKRIAKLITDLHS